jgi:hypothetical protein
MLKVDGDFGRLPFAGDHSNWKEIRRRIVSAFNAEKVVCGGG